VLKPILEYAVENKAIDAIPKISIPKQNKKKKVVTNASAKLALLYKTIMRVYKDNGFYRALFLFALFGRRFNEIATLKWSNINTLNHTYTIEAENNKIGIEQTYELPVPIAEALSHIKTDGGFVFQSQITNHKISTPKRQLEKLKKGSGVKELTMHYFRHILVSAMGETGIARTVLSASLGHTNLDTVNQFYLSANHKKASHEANLAIENITQQSDDLKTN
jgi:integrase